MDSNSVADGTRFVPDDPRLLIKLTEYAQDALWMFTPEFEELVFVNSAYEDIFGQPVDELAENPLVFLEAVHPDDQPQVEEAMGTLTSGEEIDIEFRVGQETGYDTWVWVQGQPVYEDGTLEYLAGYTRDITARKEYQRKLEQQQRDLERSNESLREFAYIASHDLQEPLRMVSSYVDLLEMEYGDELDDEAAEYMEFAVNGAKRMKRMINSLLEYSRVHTDAEAFELVSVNDIVEDTRKDLELLIADHDAELVVEDLPEVRADPDQLGQVFQNLVKNAIEHVDEDTVPRIEIASSDRDDEHVFTVTDNGPGIPAAEHDDIFKIFKKGAASHDSSSTGIGLAITQRIVQRHGGSIWVDSGADGGAKFSFTIPKDASAPTQEGSPQ